MAVIILPLGRMFVPVLVSVSVLCIHVHTVPSGQCLLGEISPPPLISTHGIEQSWQSRLSGCPVEGVLRR